MPRKSMIIVLCSIFAMIIAPLVLVFTLNPIVNATDDEPTIGMLDKAEYFNIDEDGVLSGLSLMGLNYANEYDYYDVIIPEGVTSIKGYLYYYRHFYYYNIFTYVSENKHISTPRGYVNSLVLPNSLVKIDDYALIGMFSLLTSIRIPANVTVISNNWAFYESDNLEETLLHAYQDGNISLNEIIVENESLLDDSTLLVYKNTLGIDLRYEAPKGADQTEDNDDANDAEDNEISAETTVVENEKHLNTAVVAGVATGSVVSLSTLVTALGFVVRRRRH